MLADRLREHREVLAGVHGPATQHYGGMRVVTRDEGRALDVVPSPSATYLLPELAGFSAMKRETSTDAFGHVMLCGDTVFLNAVREPHEAYLSRLQRLSHEQSWLVAPEPRLPLVCTPFSVGGELAPADLVTLPLAMTLLRSETNVRLPGNVAADRSDVRGRGRQPVIQRSAPLVDHPTTAVDEPLPADASVRDIATRMTALSGLSDDQLAKLFRVERETFCRWRSGALDNPRAGNRRRLSLLLALLEELNTRGVRIKDWLLNHSIAGSTPYELLQQGKVDEVAYHASTIGETPVPRDPDLSADMDAEPLSFEDDDVWEPQVDDEA